MMGVRFFIASWALFGFLSSPLYAFTCEGIFKGVQTMEGVVGELKNRGVQGTWVPLANGNHLPVALATPKTVESLQNVFKHSIGFIYQLQPKANSDHGLVRVRETIMDADEPVARAFGEINMTGISGFDVYENVRRKIFVTESRIELAVFLPEPELDIADFYHRVRRAAMVRVPSVFAKATVNYAALNNVVQGVSEQCFNFSYAQSLPAIVSYAEQVLAGSGVKELHAQAQDARALAFLNKVRTYLLHMTVDLHHPEQAGAYLNPNLLLQKDQRGVSFLDEIADLFPAHLDEAGRVELANWFVAYHAAKDYLALLQRIQLTNFDVKRITEYPQPAMIIIEDALGQPEARFANGTYSASGRSFTWNPRGQLPW